jgi:beta-glucosidase
MNKHLYRTSKILVNVSAIMMGLALVGGNIALDNSGAINSFFKVKTQEQITDSSTENDNLYFKSSYNSISELKDAVGQVGSKVTEEGAVLLKNDNNALPLSSGAKVSLFSSSSVNYITSGGGSSMAKAATTTSLKDGLTEAGISVNSDLWDFYLNNPKYSGMHTSNTSSDAAKYAVNDAKWDDITTDSKNNSAEAAIFVVSRFGTEATDLMSSGGSTSDLTNGDYLELSPTELDVLTHLKTLKNNGTISKIVLLLNSVNQVQCDYIDNAALGIDSILWVGEGGSNGAYGIGKILTGEVNPSGSLTDTFWKEHYLNPVYSNFGNYKNQGSVLSSANGGKSNSYVVYQEGIYNGYRYVETRYEDTVLSTANVGEFNYADTVAYPFGYGLSYSNFSYSDMTLTKKDDTYTVKVKVTNDGSVAGKEPVQLYIQKPYTQYDKDNGIEKASVELVGFAKTSLLAPGASEVVSFDVEGRDFASYDANGYGTYVVDAGNYYLSVASDAHSATNNILEEKAVKEGVSLQSSKMTSRGDSSLVESVTIDELDHTTYSTSKETGATISNQFDNADLNRYDGKGSNSVTYTTRSNWSSTVKLGLTQNHSVLSNNVVVTTTDKMKSDSAKGSSTIQQDNVEYPTYGASNGLSLASFLSIEDGKAVWADYDDERWDSLLDQLSWDDTVTLLSNGLRKTTGIDSVGKMSTIDGNGALGPVGGSSSSYNSDPSTALNRYAYLYDDPDKDTSPLQYPCSALIASTMNSTLMEEVGEVMGEDCLWAGYSGIYGLGGNIHRGAYNGRAFEYYSEDGYLAGMSAAHESKGLKKKGVYVYMKHAILNDQEKNREGVNTWCNEQAIREVYLRPFELAISEGGASNIMTGFNRVGVVWTGQHGFLNNVLRKEFGMTGFVVSDYWQDGYMDLVGGILGGNDLPDGDRASSASASPLYSYSSHYGELAWAMRESCHRILYTVGTSNAMNGVDANSVFRSITPAWIGAVKGAQIGFEVFFGCSAALFLALNVLIIVKGKHEKHNNEDGQAN